MKYAIILVCFLSSAKDVCTQELSGVWQGDLTWNCNCSYNCKYKERFNSELEIEQLTDHRVKGISNCYLLDEFYYITTTGGNYDTKTKILNLKETKLIKFKSPTN